MTGLVAVARPEAISRLVAAGRVALVVAAAGYGKTRLLHEWEAHDHRPFRRLTPAQAIEHADARTVGPEVVVIDDLDRSATADPELQRAVLALATRPGSVVALAGRSIDARFATGLRLDGEVVGLDEDDLALDDAGAGALLDGRCDDAGVARLVDRTEGWPAALRLAALALEEGVAPEDFSGRDRLVQEYLDSNVFRGLDADTLSFLEGCSVFETLDAGLCDHALQRHDAYALLGGLEAAHLFVRSLDRARQEFAIHPLVREALEARLHGTDPGAASRIRRRGADWLAQTGRSRTGLVLRLRDGDADGAAELLADVVLPMFSTGDLDPLVALIHGIGPDAAIRHGFLATMFAYAGVMTGDAAGADRWSRLAQRFYAAHRFGSRDEEVAYFTMRAHLAPDGFAVMADDAEHALDIAEESSPWRVPALQMAGIVAALRGAPATARPLLDEAVHRSIETAIRPALVLTLAERALAAGADGRAGEAREDLAAARLALGDDMRHYPHAALVWALDALYLHRGGDQDAARTAFQAANALRPVAGRALPWLGVQLRTVLARVAVAMGDLELAGSVLSEARALLGLLPDALALRRGLDDVEEAVAPLPPGRPMLPLLTTAELRVLPFLSSHLSFEEIGARLHVSRFTIKSQAISIYRKLGVTSRSDAVARARSLALIDD